MEVLGLIVDYVGIVLGIIWGEKISIPLIGVSKDLPSSITGINKRRSND